ncbi:MAG: sulfite exporter TauE/SafE family protein [Verrucomicrobiales bacterium]|nr:sulfite exporter TauE/SafE family protein [Verrucomicrobiales bacterium]
MSLTGILTALAIGVLAGVVAALCGVGGGVVMVPAFVSLMKMPQKIAVATSLAIIVPTALTATVQNARNDLIDWKVALITAVSAATFAYFGAGWLKSLSNDQLARGFGVLLIVFGVKMLLQGRG